MSLKNKLDFAAIIKSIIIVGGLYTLLIFLTIQFNNTHESLLMEYTFPINLFNIYYPEIGTLIMGTMGLTNEIINIIAFISFDLALIFGLTHSIKKLWLLVIAFVVAKGAFFLIYLYFYFETVIKLIRAIT